MQWTLYKINNEMDKPSTSIRIFLKLYTIVMDCLQDINRSIYGVSILMNNILANIAFIVYAVLIYIFIPYQMKKLSNWSLFFDIIVICLKIFDLFLLYFLAHITVKEVGTCS